MSLTFQVCTEEVDGLDFGEVYTVMKKFRGHLAVTWLKTLLNAWCTTSRMHESVVLSCVFGCASPDCTSHYICCPVLRAIVFLSLGLPVPPQVPRPLAALSLAPCTARQIIILYLSFSLYHARKNHYKTLHSLPPPYPILFTLQDHFCSVNNAHAVLTKLNSRLNVQQLTAALG